MRPPRVLNHDATANAIVTRFGHLTSFELSIEERAWLRAEIVCALQEVERASGQGENPKEP